MAKFTLVQTLNRISVDIREISQHKLQIFTNLLFLIIKYKLNFIHIFNSVMIPHISDSLFLFAITRMVVGERLELIFFLDLGILGQDILMHSTFELEPYRTLQ